MRLSDFLDDIGRPVAYYPQLALCFQSVNAAILLCQLFYWEGKQADEEEGWIYKKQEEITEETGLSRRESDTARKVLVKKKVLAEKRRGVPPILHFRIDREALDDLWDEWRKAPNQFGGKRQIKMARNATTNCANAPNQNGSNRQNIKPEITTQTTREHTHAAATRSSVESSSASSGVSVKSKFSLEQIMRYVEDCKQRGRTITNPEGMAIKLRRTGEADELVETFLNRTPDQVAEARAATNDGQMSFFEAGQLVNSMVEGQQANAAVVIANLEVSPDVRQRLEKRFVQGQGGGAR